MKRILILMVAISISGCVANKQPEYLSSLDDFSDTGAAMSTYATKTTPAGGDKALITDVADGSTKNALLSALPINDATQNALSLKADTLTTDQNYVSDVQLTVIQNTSGTNTGDQTAETLPVIAAGFDGNLTTTDDTVQEVAQKLDDLTTSGVTINDSAGDGDTTVVYSADSVFDRLALKANLTGGTFSGSLTAPSFISSAADGDRYFAVINGTAIIATPTLGRIGWYNGELRYADGTDWDGYFFKSDNVSLLDLSDGSLNGGRVGGKQVKPTNYAGSYVIGTGSDDELWGGHLYVTLTGTVTVPARVYGNNFCVSTTGAFVVHVDPNIADTITLDGVALAAGDKASSPATAGSTLCCDDKGTNAWWCLSSGPGVAWVDGN